jgi:hypothetical protein
VLFTDGVYTSSLKSLNGVAVSCLQRGKHRNVTELKLVGSVRGQTAQADIVSKAVLQDLQRFVSAEAVADR